MIIAIMMAVVIVMSVFLILIRAYSQVHYLPSIQSPSYEKSQNTTTTRASIASVSTYPTRNTNSSSSTITSQSKSNNNNDKFIIINFDDSHEGEYKYAKPILDKY